MPALSWPKHGYPISNRCSTTSASNAIDGSSRRKGWRHSQSPISARKAHPRSLSRGWECSEHQPVTSCFCGLWASSVGAFCFQSFVKIPGSRRYPARIRLTITTFCITVDYFVCLIARERIRGKRDCIGGVQLTDAFFRNESKSCNEINARCCCSPRRRDLTRRGEACATAMPHGLSTLGRKDAALQLHPGLFYQTTKRSQRVKKLSNQELMCE